MNILCLSWRGPKHPNAGGAEISTHEHAKGWVKAGHKVTLFTSGYKGAKALEYIDGVRVIRRGSQYLSVQIAAFKWFMLDRKEEFDIVIDEFHGIPFFTPLYVRSKKIGFIHEVTKEVWRMNSWKVPLSFLPSVLGTLLEPFIFRLLYTNIQFMTVSCSTKKDLVEWGIPQNQIVVIYNGLNALKKIRPFKKEKKKTLIFLGTLSKDKGIKDAIKVFRIVDQAEEGKWQFWVVGKVDPGYLEYLKVFCQKLGIRKKVSFWGFVSEDKKFELLSKAHIAINPSIREGWGLVVIEAASVGTPTIAYNVPGLRDSIINQKTGIISSENTVAELAAGILGLMDNEKKYKLISKNAILWSKRFSWKKSIKESLGLIDNLVSN